MTDDRRLRFELVASKSNSATQEISYDLISFFPWKSKDAGSISWEGVDWENTRTQRRWKTIVRKWNGVAAICDQARSGVEVRLIRTNEAIDLQELESFQIETMGYTESVHALCWSLHPETLAPLLVLGGKSSTIYIYDVEVGRVTSILRGHGGRITSLQAHPRNPQIVASTSRDSTTRLWRLDLTREFRIVFTEPEKKGLGPPFGAPLDGSEGETGRGRCFAVTDGGMASEGHKHTVLDADFHPDLDLLATSGVGTRFEQMQGTHPLPKEDHHIKLWHLDSIPSPASPRAAYVNLTRPICAVGKIHPAPVICIHWLRSNILISQSPASNSEDDEVFPGKIVVWRWLGYELFDQAMKNGWSYKGGSQNALDSGRLRPEQARDMLNLPDSYIILADIPAEFTTRLSFYGTLAVLNSRSMIRILDIRLLRPRPRPNDSKILTLDDLPYSDDSAWKKILTKEKLRLQEDAKLFDFPGVVATIIPDDEDQNGRHAVALHGRRLLRVRGRRFFVWKLVEP